MFTTVRRVLDALATALAVVLGLRPDPTRVTIRYDE